MAWTASDIPDQTGRVAVVTGANGGLGFETARELVRKGALVIMAVRNLHKAEAARDDIVSETPTALLDIRKLDLASLASIREFSGRVCRDYETIDLLINNAGVMGTPRRESADGFELQFGTNHLGHFALTTLLMPVLLRGKDARVVTVTSFGRLYGGRLREDDPHFRSGRYGPWAAYGQSKMANMRFGLELHRRLGTAGLAVKSLVAHPGYTRTDLQAASVRASRGWSQQFFNIGVELIGMPASEGALSQLRAATDRSAQSGEFYGPRWMIFGPPVKHPVTPFSRQPGAMRKLWDLSERETGITFDL